MRGLLFKTKNDNKYFFDGNTGMIDSIDQVFGRCLKLYADGYSGQQMKDELKKYGYNLQEIQGTLKYLDDLLQYGCFSDGTAYADEVSTSQIKQALYDYSNVVQLIINVTENCNFRCKYCFLSEVYNYSRNRTDKRIDFATAKKAMDMFFSEIRKIIKYNPCKEVAISFYGGEPLLCFELVKQCVEYAEENCPVNIIYSVTTNGSLLSDQVLQFFMDYNFYIGISMDGDKTNHDRNRIFSDNKGTFDIVHKNIQDLMEGFKTYKNYSILITLDYKSDLIAIDKFFEKNNLPRVSFVSMVSDKNTTYYNRFSNEDIIRFQEQYNYLRDKYICYKIANKKISSFLISLFELPMANIIYRKKVYIDHSSILPYTGACIPGSKRSVRADGTIDICERVNECFPIGNVSTGLNYTEIAKIVNRYNKSVLEQCESCPISNNCSVCFSQAMDGDAFIKPQCDNLINSYIESLYIMYSVLEENPSAYDYYQLPLEYFLNN